MAHCADLAEVQNLRSSIGVIAVPMRVHSRLRPRVKVLAVSQLLKYAEEAQDETEKGLKLARAQAWRRGREASMLFAAELPLAAWLEVQLQWT